MSEDKDQPALNASVTGHEAVAVSLLLRHAEVSAMVGHHLVEFLERAFIQEEFDPLTGGHLALFVLTSAALFAAASVRQRITPLQLCKFLFQIHSGRIISS